MAIAESIGPSAIIERALRVHSQRFSSALLSASKAAFTLFCFLHTLHGLHVDIQYHVSDFMYGVLLQEGAFSGSFVC